MPNNDLISKYEARRRWGHQKLIDKICQALSPQVIKHCMTLHGFNYRMSKNVYDATLIKTKLDEMLHAGR